MTISRLLEIIEERQVLRQRLAALDQEEKEILIGKICTDEEQIDLSPFKDTTYRLLKEFCNAPNKMLSHEDIRQDVIFEFGNIKCIVRLETVRVNNTVMILHRIIGINVCSLASAIIYV